MKYRVYIQENIKFSHEVIIAVENGRDIEKILNRAERECCFDDAIGSLEDDGCEIIKKITDEDGDFGDITIDDFNEIKGELMKFQCGSCKEFEPFLKRIKGELKTMSDGSCGLHKHYTQRTKFCLKFEVKANEN